MKALTVRQPMAHAIMHLHKNIENHSCHIHYRGSLLIHAGAYREHHPREVLAEYMKRPPTEEKLADLPLGCILGVVMLVDCVQNSKSRWANEGAWHWVLKDVRRIKPVACKGWLNLWTPSPSVKRKLPQWIKHLHWL